MAAISDIMRNNQNTECSKNGFTKKKIIVSLCYELELKKKGLDMFKVISVGFPMVFLCVGRVALH